MIRILLGTLLVLAVVVDRVGAQEPQSIEEQIVEDASAVLSEIMAIPAKAIPESLLAEAQGVVIIPGMIKGGFIVGARHGKGVLVVRDAAGHWNMPVLITVTGGSVGWQAGLNSTDVIAVFRNRRGVDGLMRGRFTIGADAGVAAGPVGRQASAATDAQLQAEILSWSRSRGLFAGVAIDGASMQVNQRANAAYYAPRPSQPQGAVPVSAVRLVQQIAAYAGAPSKLAINTKDAPAIPTTQIDDMETVSNHLAEVSLRLQKVLAPEWKEYLALPSEVFAEGKTPSKESFEKCIARYAAVANDARYQSLSSRHEFQETYALLVRYRNAAAGNKSGTLKLPPPPM